MDKGRPESVGSGDRKWSSGPGEMMGRCHSAVSRIKMPQQVSGVCKLNSSQDWVLRGPEHGPGGLGTGQGWCGCVRGETGGGDVSCL